MNWKGFGGKLSWRKRGTVPDCYWRNEVRPRKPSGSHWAIRDSRIQV